MKSKLLILFFGLGLILLSVLPSCGVLESALKPGSQESLFFVRTALREATYQAAKEEPGAKQWANGLAAVVRLSAQESDEDGAQAKSALKDALAAYAAKHWPEEPGRQLLMESTLQDALEIYGGGVTDETWKPLLRTVADALEAGAAAATLDGYGKNPQISQMDPQISQMGADGDALEDAPVGSRKDAETQREMIMVGDFGDSPPWHAWVWIGFGIVSVVELLRTRGAEDWTQFA